MEDEVLIKIIESSFFQQEVLERKDKWSNVEKKYRVELRSREWIDLNSDWEESEKALVAYPLSISPFLSNKGIPILFVLTMHSVLDDEMTGVNINDTSVSRCPCCLGSEAWLRDQILTNKI